MARSNRTRIAVAGGGLLAAGVAAAVAASLVSGPAEPEQPPGTVPLGDVQTVALTTFQDCDALLQHYREQALRLVGPYGLDGGGMYRAMAGGAAEDASAGVGGGFQPPAAQSLTAARGGDDVDSGGTSATGTNVQVSGVDEADVAKLSGDLLIAVNQSRQSITVTRLQGTRVTPLGTLKTNGWYPEQLLVAPGGRVLALGSVDPGAGVNPDVAKSSFLPMYAQQRSRLAEIEVSPSGEPRLTRSLDVDGSVIGARLTGDVARLALVTPPRQLKWAEPRFNRDGNLSRNEENRATAANRKLVGAAGLDTWLPSFTLTRYDAAGKATGTPEQGRLLDCDRVGTPPEFSGLSTLSLLGLELGSGDGVGTVDASAVVAEGSTVYATAGSTYVATNGWQPGDFRRLAGAESLAAQSGGRTAIHEFSNEGTDSRYLASGAVEGHLLNQFAMDEHDGVLRVASTTRPEFSAMPMPIDPGIGDGSTSSDAAQSQPAPPPEPSSSRVTVLRRDGDELATVGLVTGLGKTEQIRSVRFMGDVGYVVTFRQTDPLYTLDLTDAAKPRVVGELKIPGYSAYLHPAGEGRLLGLGQDADTDGRVKGLQASLFDVSDPAKPTRIATEGITGAFAAQGEENHHAFTFAEGLMLAPYEVWGDPTLSSRGASYDAGVLAVRVSAGGLAPAAMLRPQANGPIPMASDGSLPPTAQSLTSEGRPLRTFVRDGQIYTVTDAGIAVHDTRTLRRTSFTAY